MLAQLVFDISTIIACYTTYLFEIHSFTHEQSSKDCSLFYELDAI